MNPSSPFILRTGTLLAINLLFLMIWGFAGISKVVDGMPSWFGGKFGSTFLAKFPGLTATFWILAVSELAGLALAIVALARAEFARRQPPLYLGGTLVWSLFVFLQLGFGQWLTGEFAGAFQQFVYFCGTLVAMWVADGLNDPWKRIIPDEK
jgi:hypothetical protein